MKGPLPLLILLAVGLAWFSARDSTAPVSTCTACIPDLNALSPSSAPATIMQSPPMATTPAPLGPGLPFLFPNPVPMSPESTPVPSISLPYDTPPGPEDWQKKLPADRLANVRSRLLPRLHEELAARQLKPGSRAFLRAFKETRELELWLRTGTDRSADWVLFRTYPVHALSGVLGPKLREGDGQTPEGVYTVTTSAMNPASLFHLSFNVGYPNEFDRHHNRTGSAIMVHGSDVSIGCLAMSDPVIEEIYLLVQEALDHAQTGVPIHLFPFRMTDEKMAAAADSPHLTFWQDLKPIYDRFETRREVPRVRVTDGRYVLERAVTTR